MELNFLRHDLTNTASTARNSLRVLPLGKKAKQKVVVGDSTGTVHSFSLGKQNELVTSFKMALANPNQQPKPVAFIDLFGDKIFVASGEVINGISRKGKPFFRLEINLAEAISSMVVRTPFIWTAGEYVLNMFEEGREEHFYMSPDKINHICTEHLTNDKTLDSVLACNDRMLRVVKHSAAESELAGEHGVEGSTNVVCVYASKNGQTRDVVYGTVNGHLGAYRIANNTLARRWNRDPAEHSGGFNALITSDFTKDGTNELLIGRDNGYMEIYNFDGANQEPSLVYQTTLNEMITGMDVGLITTPSKDELVVSTFSGKILCFSLTQVEAPPPVPPAMGQRIAAEAADSARKRTEKKIQFLTSEIEKLRDRLEKKKEEYTKMSEEHIAVSPDYKVRDKFVLDSQAFWVLTIELDCPVERVSLQCDVEVELMDVEGNAAIISRTTPDKDAPTKLLAVYRNTDSTNRMEVKVRTVEGQYGTLQAFVIPSLAPKTAVLTSYCVRPLSLHQRLTEKPAELDSLVMNSLTIAGSFSLSDMNSWVSQCLPEVPDRTNADELTFYFLSTFQKTTLVAKYRAGEAVFRSDNVSTLAIIKDFVTKQATTRKVQVKPSFEIRDETCSAVLELLHPKLRYQLGLSEKVKLIDALKEIQMQEQDVTFLAAEYKEILENAKTIEKEFELQPRRLEFLHNIVKSLYVDRHKFKGQQVGHKLSILQEKLEHYDLKELQQFIIQGN